MNKFLFTILFCSSCLAMDPAREGVALSAKLVEAENQQMNSLIERGLFAHQIRVQIRDAKSQQGDLNELLKKEQLIKLHAKQALARKMLEKATAELKGAESTTNDVKMPAVSTKSNLTNSSCLSNDSVN